MTAKKTLRGKIRLKGFRVFSNLVGEKDSRVQGFVINGMDGFFLNAGTALKISRISQQIAFAGIL